MDKTKSKAFLKENSRVICIEAIFLSSNCVKGKFLGKFNADVIDFRLSLGLFKVDQNVTQFK